jgi:hypothetical protein
MFKNTGSGIYPPVLADMQSDRVVGMGIKLNNTTVNKLGILHFHVPFIIRGKMLK